MIELQARFAPDPASVPHVNVELASLKSYESLLVLAMHGTTTLISWSAYLEPLKNILFFAAWLMLAACITLFLLRDMIASPRFPDSATRRAPWASRGAS